MVMADTGEDAVIFCSNAGCGYAANLEKAEIARPEPPQDGVALKPLEEVHTPDVRTIEEVCEFLRVKAEEIVKTLIFLCDGKPVAVLVRGDHEINEAKLRSRLKCENLELAPDDVVLQATGSPKGFAGAIGVKAEILADYSLLAMKNFVMGGNKEDYHVRNANLERDFRVKEFADLRFATPVDRCARCGSPLEFARGIEVGHVFKLGTKYSKAMKATYLDRNGQEQLMVMGCYGIGIGRTVAACIEQNHDEKGIVWPMSVAPYHVIITPVNINDARLAGAAEEIYGALTAAGLDVILDDRDERAGVKFNDADLIGIPLRVTIGPKRIAEGRVEVRERKTGETKVLTIPEALDFIISAFRREVDIKCFE
jgi:prolyl-tRNA synthetase